MIKGIGTDIIEISRVTRAAENEKFLERWFTANERSFFAGKGSRKYESIAANFAAKEAAAKALGTGFAGFSAADIEILRDERGAPYVNLFDGAKARAESLGVSEIFVSLSHCESYAVAYVVMEML